eukprot:scaffold6.g2636.t1
MAKGRREPQPPSSSDASDELSLSGPSASEDSDGEQGGPPPAKRARLDDAAAALGLEVHAAPAVGGAAASIDHAEEAEASLLQLEVAELVAQARPDPGAEGGLVELLHRLADLLRSLPEAEVDPGPVKGLLRNLRFAAAKPFVFRPPARVRVVGSFALRAAAGPSPCVDVAVEMPAECFDAKDQLNHRYHAKRALYLAHLAGVVGGLPGVASVAWESFVADPRRPALGVELAAGLAPGGLRLRLLPALPRHAFPLHRLAPGRNNLRTAAGTKPADGQEPQLAPTPHYNASILQDLMLIEQSEVCKRVAAVVRGFPEAAVLLRIWARQHHLDAGADGVSGALLTMLLAHLAQTGQAVAHPPRTASLLQSASMSPMHLFRTVLVALSSPKTFSGGLFMQRRMGDEAQGQQGKIEAAAPPDAKAWRRAHEVVFVDPSGWLNLAAGVSAAALGGARAAASRALASLNAGTPEGFAAVFLAGQGFASQWDYIYHVTLAQEEEGAAALDGDEPSWRACERRVEALAAQALGTRARLVRAVRRAPGRARPRRGAAPPERPHMLLCVRADPASAARAVDLGPPADQAAAAGRFRALWGDKAELRRFQDGSICEAVVWEAGPAERHRIPDQAVAHVLGRHFPAGAVVAAHAGALDAALRRRHSTPDSDAAAVRLCEAATERLCKRLRALGGASLRVVATQPLAAVARRAAAFPPLPHRLAGAPEEALASEHVARCLDPVEVLCQLEGSGRWPESLEAFAKTKAALGAQLAQLLAQSYGMEASAAEGYVDVLSDGFAFRLRLATERDAAMAAKLLAIRRAVEGPGAASAPDDDAALRAWHQGAVGGVAAASPAFEGAVRLAKRWVGAHLLSPHLAEEAVELLVASLFAGEAAPARATDGAAAPPGGAGGAAAAAPAAPLAGFLRFLRLLADHPWRVQPLIVDPQAELSASQRDAILRQHAARRGAGTAPALCLATARDPGGGAWTAGRPAPQLLPRLVVLAQRSAAALEGLLLPTAAPADGGTAAAAAAAAIFARDATEYDALLHLRRDALPNADRDVRVPGARERDGAGAPRSGAEEALRAEAESATTKHSRAILKGIPQSILAARGARAVRRELLVGFDPLPIYVAALERRFSDLAVFCADFVGGGLVGVKWRPAARALAAAAAGPAGDAATGDVVPGTTGKKGGKGRKAGGGAANGAAAGALRQQPLVELLADMVHHTMLSQLASKSPLHRDWQHADSSTGQEASIQHALMSRGIAGPAMGSPLTKWYSSQRDFSLYSVPRPLPTDAFTLPKAWLSGPALLANLYVPKEGLSGAILQPDASPAGVLARARQLTAAAAGTGGGPVAGGSGEQSLAQLPCIAVKLAAAAVDDAPASPPPSPAACPASPDAPAAAPRRPSLDPASPTVELPAAQSAPGVTAAAALLTSVPAAPEPPALAPSTPEPKPVPAAVGPPPAAVPMQAAAALPASEIEPAREPAARATAALEAPATPAPAAAPALVIAFRPAAPRTAPRVHPRCHQQVSLTWLASKLRCLMAPAVVD